MVAGGMEEDDCVWRGVEDSWERLQIYKKFIQMN
jgi:hypothetical protein